MDLADRRAAVALKSVERPDVRALRSALAKVERNFDDVLLLQEEEIQRLRRLIAVLSNRYRDMAGSGAKVGTAKFRKFADAMEAVCLEADAITFAEDLAPKQRAVKKRG